jgi:hypothetical protein
MTPRLVVSSITVVVPAAQLPDFLLGGGEQSLDTGDIGATPFLGQGQL